MTAVLSEREQYQEKHFEQLREEITALQTRLQAIEQKIVSDEMESVKAPQKSVSRKESTREGNLEAGKKAYEDGDFDNAIEFLKGVANGNSTNPDSRKALYLLAESYYGARDFATAAIEFGEYKQLYPKDPLVPTAIYRQANAFRNLGKTKEAKLFYQELIDRHAKHPLVAKAKQEMKKLAAK